MTICKHCAQEKLCRHTNEPLEDCSGFDPIFDPVQQAVQTYGAEAQKWVLIGEVGELLDAIADHRRGRCDVRHVAEEIADVLICLEQLQVIYECAKSVQIWKYAKLHRLAERLAKEEEDHSGEETDCHGHKLPRNDSMEKKTPSVEPDLLAEYPQIVQCLYRCSSYDCNESCRYHGRDECSDGLMQDAALLLDKFAAALLRKEPDT